MADINIQWLLASAINMVNILKIILTADLGIVLSEKWGLRAQFESVSYWENIKKK